MNLLRECSGVYLIFNKINGKTYVGSSVRVRVRIRQHVRDLKTGFHCNDHLQNALSKYGEDAFIFCLWEEVEPTELLIREQHWIDYLKPAYNICKTAGNTLGRKHTTATKQLIGNLMKGKSHHSQLGMKHSIERRQANSAGQLGKKLTLEHRKSIALGSLQNLKTHCPKQHPYSLENTYIHGRKRFCRECSRVKARNAYRKQ